MDHQQIGMEIFTFGKHYFNLPLNYSNVNPFTHTSDRKRGYENLMKDGLDSNRYPKVTAGGARDGVQTTWWEPRKGILKM